jgi:hypothetical protein
MAEGTRESKKMGTRRYQGEEEKYKSQGKGELNGGFDLRGKEADLTMTSQQQSKSGKGNQKSVKLLEEMAWSRSDPLTCKMKLMTTSEP